MNFNRKPIFTAPREVEETFYQAFASRDLDRMMSVWADEDDIVCVMPSGQCLQGFSKIREGWKSIFSRQPGSIELNINVRQTTDGVMMAIHHVVEEINIKDGDKHHHGKVLAVNVYQRTPDGWRLFLHQGTSMQVEAQVVEDVPAVNVPVELWHGKRTLH